MANAQDIPPTANGRTLDLSAGTILFIDDNERFLTTVRRTLGKHFDVETESDPLKGLEKISSGRHYAVVVADMRMPGMNGISLLARAMENNPCVIRVLFTAYADLTTAIEAVNKGHIFRFITKPCPLATLREHMEASLLHYRWQRLGVCLEEKDLLRAVSGRKEASLRLIGHSEEMRAILGLVKQLADLSTTVLITGESGTGKELIAEALHYGGARSGQPLVKVNCSALAENLLESELFGHVRGAFTGAVADRIGRFEAAKEGTLMLDEIGELSPGLQVKLLRVLEYREFQRVGESTTRRTKARILAATNADLSKKISKGTFREDLYYRLKVMHLHLPPLRERREDTQLLAEHFLHAFRERHKKPAQEFSVEAMALLTQYDWPGNVRELEHAVERACIFCPGETILSEYLPPETIALAQEDSVVEIEGRGNSQERIADALKKSGGNKAKAARLLGVSRTTLYRWLKDNDHLLPE
jgi:DNA-binding NtrC family response regulator